MTTTPEDNPRFHPLANVFPLLSEAEFADLVRDIRANGQMDPIVMFEGLILDGRNRYLAIEEINKDLPVNERMPHTEIKFEQKWPGREAADYVWSHNVVRRHLTQGQIDFAAQALEELGWGGKPGNRNAAKDKTEMQTGTTEEPRTRKAIAKETGATVRGMAKAAKVRKRATPKVQKAVRDGDLTLNAADRIADLPPEEQEEVMADPKPADAVTRRETLGTKRTAARKPVNPVVSMKGHMTGHQSGIRDVVLINKFWAENKDKIGELDGDDLRSFIKDLEESRRAASQLLTLLADVLVPEWTLPGKQPALLSTALNKIDLAAKNGEGTEEGK